MRINHQKSAVDAATYTPYNANNRGNNSPDCVKRAISMAFNIDYNQVSKILLAKAKQLNRSKWNILPVYEPVIYQLGGSERKVPSEPIQVADFIDQYVPQGICIMETGKRPAKPGYGDHLTCCVDGNLFDSWNSLDQYVCQYYIVENVVHEFGDVDDHLTELIAEGSQFIQEIWPKYQQKYNLPGEFRFVRGSEKSQFAIYFKLAYIDKAAMNEIIENWDLVCVFTPTMSLEAARKKMIETIKIRMYDKFYAINQKYSQRAEADQLFYESGYTDADRKKLWLDSREERFYHSLPGWIKPFIVNLCIQYPGQYTDSYEVTALPIKGDPRRDNVYFFGYNSADVKDEINRYKKSFERVGDDYSYAETY